jgi:hypothetical protein
MGHIPSAGYRCTSTAGSLPEQEAGPGLKVATVGAVPPNPVELPGSRRFAHLLAQARETFDYLLIDATPLVWFPTRLYSPRKKTASCKSSILKTDAKGSCSKLCTAWKRSVHKRSIVVNNIEIQESSYYKYDRKDSSKSGTAEVLLRTTRRASGEMR